MKRPIYLDYQATTPVDPRVLDAMMPFFREDFGNAASRTHAFGWRAEEAVENARRETAELIGASAREIVFRPQGGMGWVRGWRRTPPPHRGGVTCLVKSRDYVVT